MLADWHVSSRDAETGGEPKMSVKKSPGADGGAVLAFGAEPPEELKDGNLSLLPFFG